MNPVSRLIRQHQRVRHAVYQTESNIFRSMTRTASTLLLFVGVHALAMMWLESMTPWQAVWLTLTTLATVGYGDVSAQTPLGQLMTIVLM
ncbi:potassium channel family protein, partial [Wenyingzhuangia sp. 1_MG-2023]|nr:potassium channel family protein [Wenyingzhuangia sp. 1_MG-2023]